MDRDEIKKQIKDKKADANSLLRIVFDIRPKQAEQVDRIIDLIIEAAVLQIKLNDEDRK